MFKIQNLQNPKHKNSRFRSPQEASTSLILILLFISSMSSAFQLTSKFSEVAKVINSLPADKFVVILKRILKRLHVKGTLFDKEEVSQLLTVFNLTAAQLQNVLDCCCYIFEQVCQYVVYRIVFLLTNLKKNVNVCDRRLLPALAQSRCLPY